MRPRDLPVTQDALGTHLDWEHDGITPRMIDWFWSNMEKGFLLWHPSEHEPLSWAVPVAPGNLVGAVHLAPQTWSDGTFRNLYIRFEDPATLAPEIQERIVLRALRRRRGARLRAGEPRRRASRWATASTSGRRPTPASSAARPRSARRMPETPGGGPRLGEALRRGDRQLGRVPPAALRALSGRRRAPSTTRTPTSPSCATRRRRPLPGRVVSEIRAEVVGSLLRPPALVDARAAFRAGTLDPEEYRRVEDAAVDDALRLQEAAGVDVVTDGEMRRSIFFEFFVSGLDGLEPASRAHGQVPRQAARGCDGGHDPVHRDGPDRAASVPRRRRAPLRHASARACR